MRRKHLESALSSVQREFPSPNVALEQYPTSPELAASVILTALENGDVGPGRSALDLGSGTGMLALGCALVDCDWVMGVDCDVEALAVAAENIRDMELDDQISLLLARVKGSSSAGQKSNSSQRRSHGPRKGKGRGRGRGRNSGRASVPTLERIEGPACAEDDDRLPLRSNCVDTVITNPPFGTKNNAGMDVRFLRAATRLARRAVYSFHKTSTRQFLLRTVESWGMMVQVVAEMRFDLPQTYKFHKEKSIDIEVDLIRVLLAGVEEGSGGEGDNEDGQEDRWEDSSG